ncbi:TetR family transcriptional regulator [Streptomyces antioxidans]|uniref:TetR family transcriptional regulator n=1 Tax=Streptomyces antioxidans TaxID=1507734 RepID=A0A1V4DCI8_9ACTN|nr:TetR/AcrR family transcriptional regulator [Streptomyces antioxidans]OPF83843.1 TetR family transcriptional regulator [Streptomyces antioxidans]
MARPRKFVEADAERAARDTFHRKGFAGTSLSDLAEATGLGKGSLYNTFGSKEELYARAFHSYCDDAITNTAQILERSQPGLHGVLAYVERIVEETIEDPARPGCMIAKATSELGSTTPAVRGEAHRTLRAMEDALATHLSQARDNGELRPDSGDPEDLATLVLALTRGIEALGAAGYDADALLKIGPVLHQLVAAASKTP